MSNKEASDVGRLELESVIGFAGAVPNGLLVHPDRDHLIYPLGNTVVIEQIKTGKQSCLSGHTDNVTCVAVSKSGRYLASGQQAHMGFKASVIVWDYAEKKLKYQLTLHKVKVEALAFSPNDEYLVSLGGQDDGSVVVWDLQAGEAVCGSPAAVPSAGTTNAVAFANHNDNLFITGGNKTLRVWELDRPNRKIRPTECNMGQLKRIVNCIKVTEDDTHFFCGTTSGDILMINIQNRLFRHYGPAKEKFSQGVTAMELIKGGQELLVGAGDGTVAVVDCKNFKVSKANSKLCKVEGDITSIALRGQGHQFFVGTKLSQMYRFNFPEFTYERINTCHYDKVNDVVFPFGFSDIFATCSKNEIRVWNTNTSKELLRIVVPNVTCNTVDIQKDGKAFVSGWDDGKIRVFRPESGQLFYEISDAHSKGVTAVIVNSTCSKIVSGGGEGQVRVWEGKKLLGMMKEHKGSVTCIKLKRDDTECVSASTDGTCIIWNLESFVRSQIVFANTMFEAVCYHPSDCQIITAGTDRKIAYWETFDGALIRDLEGSSAGSIQGMDIALDDSVTHFVTGGADKLLKVWDYDAGQVTHLGGGHSGDITRVKICPNSRWIVSVSADGAILRWRYPYSSHNTMQQMTDR
ncbi:predicted protein [Nematostella vectensis]|uniref:Cilia- and flagella-associated protein 52 n=2 Tax=Nematostella vectensis TaxID=45351 RepID=A7RKM0_NEMVE|nr:predicted protein [Nematostella vectensis]|eukprot:XP_001640073.1 predicted protein [Nematostella vectensis]